MHTDWFILPLLLPTPTIWFSLDRKRRIHKWSPKKMERSDSSDSDSVALMIPLTNPSFDFHKVINALTTPTLVKTSLNNVIFFLLLLLSRP